MKTLLILFVALLFTSITSSAQSDSYQLLKDKFKGEQDVYSFSFSGWMGRAILKMAGENEFRDAIKDLKHVRFITIPKSEFTARQVTVNGFKKLLQKDYYEELAYVRDNGEEVTIYLRQGNNNKNHYFVLVEEEREVVAIEMKGYIDLKEINPKSVTIASNK